MKKYNIYNEEVKGNWLSISESKLYRLFTIAQGTFEDEKAFDEYEGDFGAWKHDLTRWDMLRVMNA